jgi:hypothetical protein
MIVHHVEVDQVGAGFDHRIDLLAQAREVGRQDGGGDPVGVLRLRDISHGVSLAARPSG